MIACYHEQPALIQANGAEQVVEELPRKFILVRFARIRNVSGREDQIGYTSLLSVLSNRLDQCPQYDIAIIRVSLLM